MENKPTNPEDEARAQVVEFQTGRKCGPCSLCCKVAIVPELQKPGGVWCGYAKLPAQGCRVYGDSQRRPRVCDRFNCAWILQRAMPDNMRPDLVNAYITGLKGMEGIAVHVDPQHPDAWRTGALGEYLKMLSAKGVRIAVAIGEKRYAIIQGELFGAVDTKDYLNGARGG